MGKRVVIIGGGPAGLSAAYTLLLNGIKPVIVEMESKVGGIAKTIYEDGNGTDIGPHRFFTKDSDVMELWQKFLPFQGAPSVDDKLLNRKVSLLSGGADPEINDKVFLKRRRFSRIYYNDKFLSYPIKLNPATIFALGFSKTFVAGLSYIKSCFVKLPETNLETFMINRFGRVLYELFFEGYTTKVWGMHPSKISKEWGVQRIKGISLMTVLLNAVMSPFMRKKETSLIDEYYYPKLGSSQLWEEMAQEIKKKGGEIILNAEVVGINKSDNKINSIKIKSGNEEYEISGDIFISSMPIKDLIERMNGVPETVYNIANNLLYRDFILVNFVTDNINLKNNTNYPTINNIAPDSWIYLQDNGVTAGRLDIMNNFSPYMIRNFQENVVINLEYFCNENDGFWNQSDDDIIGFGISELKNLNIIDESNIKSSKVIRVKKAYPSYFGSYEKFNIVKDYINSLDNLFCIGRNGQHKYNNMDHSILSGLTVSKVITENLDKNVLWNVNTETKYHETN